MNPVPSGLKKGDRSNLCAAPNRPSRQIGPIPIIPASSSVALVVLAMLVVFTFVAVLPSSWGSRGADQANILDDTSRVRTWVSVEDFPTRIALFRTVFWEPADTASLRKLIRVTPLVKDKTILEIGTGSGLVSLCCLEAGARRVVATDVNRSAIDNAKYNAYVLGFEDRIDLRLVPLDDTRAYAVIGSQERFDLILSNPPWEDDSPKAIEDYAYYDPSFELIRSMLRELRDHLNPGGKALLAYGCVTAIKVIHQLADEFKLDVKVLDDRDLDSLPEVFLPGMLLEVKPKL